ncbi:Lon protease 2 [Clostridium sp. N3C]|uniref:ATP-dependent protease LonB n=1 Tax=Clostridium sp. N3C TaxID=1776758 RepID=UPI00092E12E2|nr:ATP-dependent protease LonB [Clostridium sp. N3C]SCN22389.1 Lon protease 2 [Clostridium sp. N3C]
MINILIIVQFFFTIVTGVYFLNALKGQTSNKVLIDKENKKEMEKLRKMRALSLTDPLTEKSRPTSYKEIIGQEDGIKALKSALCGKNPQHVIIYGPPGVGKTAAARLVLEYAKKQAESPFTKDSKFVEIDATTIRYDERGIADPLIGSVHDPIYQGAGALGIAGIPQPKPGAVTKAHGGILFIDEIGELQPIVLNKLLKVLEDRKVFLDSAYYSSEDPNIPPYIKEIFENGLPADFRLIGATTRSPEEISPAIRSRCIEIFFKALQCEDIMIIAKNAVKKLDLDVEEKALYLIGKYCTNGREAVNLVQLAAGVALNDGRKIINIDDIQWAVENGAYTPRIEKSIKEKPKIGYVNGLAVYGANIGAIMEIEAAAKKVKFNKGKIKVTGIVEEEQINSIDRKIIRKSNAKCSVENALTVLTNIFDIDCEEYDIHINFPGGVPVDGPSAGISITSAIYSAIKRLPISNKIAMTGEISLHGEVKAVGGINAKIAAARKAGVKKVIIPKENWVDRHNEFKDIEIIAVSHIKEVIPFVFENNESDNEISIEKDNNVGIKSAQPNIL